MSFGFLPESETVRYEQRIIGADDTVHLMLIAIARLKRALSTAMKMVK
jgi:hypothetical protein